MLPLKKNVDDYMQCNAYCPFCDSENFDHSAPFEMDAAIAWRDIQCPDCNKQWREEYTLVGISVRPDPESESEDTWYSDESKHDGEHYSHESGYNLPDHHSLPKQSVDA